MEGLALAHKEDALPWEWGDWALKVQTHYGDHTLENWAMEIGKDFNRLCDYRKTSKAYEKGVRTPNLSWTHHYLVAPKENRLYWLKQAETHKWSVAQLKESVITAEVKQRDMAFALIHALEYLSKLETTPEEFIAECPTNLWKDVDPYLEHCAQWLSQLEEARNAKRP